MDKQRELFEVWAKERFGWQDGRFEMYLGEYVNGKTFGKWQVWQAAIASVVVDVESLPSASYTDDGVVYRRHVEDALEKAGIKCK